MELLEKTSFHQSNMKLLRSVQKHDVAAVYEALLEGAHVDSVGQLARARDKLGLTPLMLAALDGHERMVGLLLEHK